MKAAQHQKRTPKGSAPSDQLMADDTLIAFTECARTGSMTVAAQKLGTGPSRISKAIARLEQRLQVSLLRRNTRQMTLTPSGQAFYERAIAILEQIQVAESMASWSPTAPKGTVTIAASSHIASNILAPRLNAFLKRYPGVVLQVEVLDDQDQTLLDAPADIKLLTAAAPSDKAVRLAAAPRYLVASAQYCAAEGRPRCPEDLDRHRLLGQTATSWTLAGPVSCALKVKNLLTTNDVGTLQAAAKAGLGIALVSPIGLADEIAAGTVERVLPAFQGPPEVFWAVAHSARLPAVELALSYVKGIFAAMDASWCDLPGDEAFADGMRRNPATPCRAGARRASYRARRAERRRTAPGAHSG